MPRVSVFDPTTLANLIAWWSPRGGVTANNNAGQMTAWIDLVAGNTLTFNTVNASMVWSAFAINGRPGVSTLCNTNAIAATSALTIPQPNTTYLVCAHASGVAWNAIDGTGSNRQVFGFSATNSPTLFAGSSLVSAVVATSSANVYCAEWNSTASTLYMNGSATPIASGDAGTEGLSPTMSFAGVVTATSGLLGDILVFRGLHGPAERCAVMSWLGSIYNIAGCG